MARCFLVALLLVAVAACTDPGGIVAGKRPCVWQELATVGDKQSRLAGSHWPHDKHPDTPEITPRSRTTLLDVDGPGVVSGLHVSQYRSDTPGNPATQAALILRVWYDDEPQPAIEMPWVDFLADIEGTSSYFATIYFSKVKESHNFRLPMPFRKHIRMEVENPTDAKFTGYTEVQWEKLPAFPDSCGMLRTDYRTGTAQLPQEVIELCHIRVPGAIVAHWLQIQSARHGELLCEGNTEFYCDGQRQPALESLGTEDLYGYSWGFSGVQSDHVTAIIKQESLPNGGARFGLLRCRALDRISFDRSCRVVADYTQEFWSALSKNQRHARNAKVNLEAAYRSCYYFYSPAPNR